MKKITLVLSLAVLSVIAFVSCKKDSNSSRDAVLNIASTIGYVAPNPPGVGPANIPAMKTVENGRTDTTFLTLERIEGFNYTEGYKYVIKVRVSQIKNPPADGYSISYKLLETISKEKED